MPTETRMVMEGRFDLTLVALSVVIANAASYTALDLASRVPGSTGRPRLAWLGAAAIAMGGGIWSMHFIAMLAFITPMPVTYDVGLSILSFLVAVMVTGVAFILASRQHTALEQITAAGLFMGTGICAMHYVGMAAMRMPAYIDYDYPLVGLSFVIAAGASIVGLGLAF